MVQSYRIVAISANFWDNQLINVTNVTRRDVAQRNQGWRRDSLPLRILFRTLFTAGL